MSFLNFIEKYDYFIIPFCIVLLIVFIFRNQLRNVKFFRFENEEVVQLRERIKLLEAYANELENKVRTMENLVNNLLERITQLNARQFEPLKEEIKSLKINTKRPTRPVLLVYGTAEFGEQDRNSLRRAGISFFRLKQANLEELKNELHRRRSEENLYDIVHISSHGGGEKLLLATEEVDAIELSNVLVGVRGIFLATCSNHNIADKLLGIVNYVVVIYEEISTQLLANFVFEFYKRYKNDWDIEVAFNEALVVMPEVSEFVDLRIGGTHV